MSARLDGDIAVGDRVRIDSGNYQGREGTIVCFYAAGFGADVRFDDGSEVYKITSRLTVIDALGLCRIHRISTCTICCGPPS